MGRLFVLPVLFCRREWIFRDISDQHRLRSVMLVELRRIMTAASLNDTYRVVDWFMKKNRLFVHVAREGQEIDRGFNSHLKAVRSWVRRLLAWARWKLSFRSKRKLRFSSHSESIPHW